MYHFAKRSLGFVVQNEVDDSISNDSSSEEENLVTNLKQVLGQHIFHMTRPAQEGSMSR